MNKLSQQLVTDLERNARILHRELEGMTHEDSIVQLPFRGNCTNWVVGHMVFYRGVLATMIGGENMAAAYEGLYGYGSEPITGDGQGKRFEALLADFNGITADLLQHVKKTTMAQWNTAKQDDEGNETTVFDDFAFYVWHDTYHVGQLEYLGQVRV